MGVCGGREGEALRRELVEDGAEIYERRAGRCRVRECVKKTAERELGEGKQWLRVEMGGKMTGVCYFNNILERKI